MGNNHGDCKSPFSRVVGPFQMGFYGLSWFTGRWPKLVKETSLGPAPILHCTPIVGGRVFHDGIPISAISKSLQPRVVCMTSNDPGAIFELQTMVFLASEKTNDLFE